MLLPETDFPISDITEKDAKLVRQIWGRPIPDPAVVNDFLEIGSQPVIPATYSVRTYVSGVGRNVLPKLHAADGSGVAALLSGMRLYASLFAMKYGSTELPLVETAVLRAGGTEVDDFIEQADGSIEEKSELKELLGHMVSGLLLPDDCKRVAIVGSGALHLAVMASQNAEKNVVRVEQMDKDMMQTFGRELEEMENAADLADLQDLFRDMGMN